MFTSHHKVYKFSTLICYCRNTLFIAPARQTCTAAETEQQTYAPGNDPRRQFSRLAQELAPYTEQCIISFMDFYGKCLKRKECQAWREPAPEEMYALAENLAGIAKQNGLAINACAEKMDLSAAGIGNAHCIDAALIGRITGKNIFSGKDKHQRPKCGCAVSRDIGTYGTCRHDCVYCYAN